MRTISFGDLHGREVWKTFGDIPELIHNKEKGYDCSPEYDYYIFMGDYVDDFHISDDKIYINLQDVLRFKRWFPDNVILLIGNHDLQYMFAPQLFGCSGFRESMYKSERNDLHALFNEHIECFTPIFEIQVPHKNMTYIWTHAGVSKTFYDMFIEDCSYTASDGKISQKIYEMFQKDLSRNNPVHWVSKVRGGSSEVAGIFWADKEETQFDQIKGVVQIIGHTHIKKIESNLNNNYIDSLGVGLQENKPFELNIN